MMSATDMETVEYGGEELSFSITRNANLPAKIRIHVYPNSSIEVEAPENESMAHIKKAVLKRARWISKQREEFDLTRRYALPREYTNGETHFYLGRRHKLKVEIDRRQSSVVKLVKGQIFIRTRVDDKAALKRRLNNWYFEKADKYIRHRLKLVADETSWVSAVPPMKLVTMSKQWGSLSPQGIVHINPFLVKAPVDCIDYVLCHELCHFVERNHSRRFYRLLQSRLPDWEHRKSKLDGLAELILVQ